MSFSKDTNEVDNRTEDLMILELGKTSSAFYSYNTFKADSAIKADINLGVPAGEMLANRAKYGRKGQLYKIFKNNDSKKIMVFDKIIFDEYRYEEDLNAQMWQLKEDLDTILGYPVQLATCSFGGRDFEAWFTSDIAINNGPWKFGGLPGLILKVEDTKKHYSFVINGIEKAKSSQKIIEFPTEKNIKLSKADFLSLNERFTRKPHEFVRNHLGIQEVPINDAAKEAVKRIQPYNPIEWY